MRKRGEGGGGGGGGSEEKRKFLTPQADRKMLPVTSKNFEFEQIQSKN